MPHIVGLGDDQLERVLDGEDALAVGNFKDQGFGRSCLAEPEVPETIRMRSPPGSDPDRMGFAGEIDCLVKVATVVAKLLRRL